MMEKNSIKDGILKTNECCVDTRPSIDANSTKSVSFVEEKEREKCRHFSIRGYVAEIRKKDWRISWPFVSVGNNEEPDKQADMFPPLDVPEFKWWGCENCVGKSGASDNAENIRVVSNSFEKEKISEGKKANDNTLVDVFTSRDLKNSAERGVDQTVITQASVGGINNECASNSSIQMCQKERLASITPVVANSSEQKAEQRTVENKVLDSFVSDTRKYLPTEFDENGSDKDEDNPILNCKKPQKVRLLKDIIACGASNKIPSSNRIADSGKVRCKSTDESDCLALVTHYGNQVAVQATKREKENKYINFAIVSSKFGNGPFSGVALHSGSKRQKNESWIEGKLFPSKNKHKKPRIEEGQSSGKPMRESLYRELQLMSTDRESKGGRVETLQPQIAENESRKRAFHQFLKFDLDTHRKSSTLKNIKVEVFSVQDGIASLMHRNRDLPRGNQVAGKDDEIKPYVALKKPDEFPRKCASRGLKRKKVNFGEACSSVKIDNKSKVQDGASPISPKDSPSVHNFGNEKDVQQHSKLTRNQSSERTNMVNESESVDEIPFEIVELLAKNRHEKCLLEAENTSQRSASETAKNMKNGEMIEFTGAHEIGVSRNSHSRNPRIRKPLRPVEGKLISCAHPKQIFRNIGSDINFLEKSQKGFLDFSNFQGNYSGGNQFAEAGLSRDFGIQKQNLFEKNAEQPCACTQKKTRYWPELVGPLDSCANETMPATQLLRLMDSGIRSSVSHDVGFSVQGDNNNCTRNSGINNLISEKTASHCVKPRKKVKTAKNRSFYSSMQTKDCSLHVTASESGKIQESSHIGGLREGFNYSLNSLAIPLRHCLDEDSVIGVEVNKKVGKVGLVEDSCMTEICSFNRNPADFSLPEARNEFTIGFGDMKCRKGISKRGRPRLRMMKLLTLKGHAQN